jgi:hypothetical protein
VSQKLRDSRRRASFAVHTERVSLVEGIDVAAWPEVVETPGTAAAIDTEEFQESALG